MTASGQQKQLAKAIKLCKNDTAHLALHELLDLAEQGCNEALFYIGHIYECGAKLVDRDYNKAVVYYNKCIEKLNPIAAYLGLIRVHFESKDENHDCHKSLKYCSHIYGKTNDPEVDYFIGRIYLQDCCIAKDLKKAEEHLRKSWKSGYAPGLLFLGYVEKITGRKLIGLIHRLRAAYLIYKES